MKFQVGQTVRGTSSKLPYLIIDSKQEDYSPAWYKVLCVVRGLPHIRHMIEDCFEECPNQEIQVTVVDKQMKTFRASVEDPYEITLVIRTQSYQEAYQQAIDFYNDILGPQRSIILLKEMTTEP